MDDHAPFPRDVDFDPVFREILDLRTHLTGPRPLPVRPNFRPTRSASDRLGLRFAGTTRRGCSHTGVLRHRFDEVVAEPAPTPHDLGWA